MAVSLLSREVSSLCIGKPPLKSLHVSVTVGDAIRTLKSSAEAYLSVESSTAEIHDYDRNKKASATVGKICMADVLCYLCRSENISSPTAALKKPVSVLLPKDPSQGIHRIDPNSRITEALDAILGDRTATHSLVVPTRRRTEVAYCWLTQEDFVRFFLDSIGLFSTIASLSVTSLGLVRPAVLSVRYHEPAVSALNLIRSALDDHTAVAVVTDDGRLVGEISPSALSACDETVAAAIVSLSAGDLMGYIDCCGGGVLTDSVVLAVKERLRRNGMEGMIQLMEEDTLTSLTSSSSSSSSDEELEVISKRKRTKTSSNCNSARRSTGEAIVCRAESSLVAVMVQALAHRVNYVWVVDDDYGLVGVVTFLDVLRVFREQVPKA